MSYATPEKVSALKALVADAARPDSQDVHPFEGNWDSVRRVDALLFALAKTEALYVLDELLNEKEGN